MWRCGAPKKLAQRHYSHRLSALNPTQLRAGSPLDATTSVPTGRMKTGKAFFPSRKSVLGTALGSGD